MTPLGLVYFTKKPLPLPIDGNLKRILCIETRLHIMSSRSVCPFNSGLQSKIVSLSLSRFWIRNQVLVCVLLLTKKQRGIEVIEVYEAGEAHLRWLNPTTVNHQIQPMASQPALKRKGDPTHGILTAQLCWLNFFSRTSALGTRCWMNFFPEPTQNHPMRLRNVTVQGYLNLGD